MNRPILLLISVTFCTSIAFSSGSAQAGEVATIPADWLDQTPDLYPIKNAPGPVRWQIWRIIKEMSAKKDHAPYYIESYGASTAAAQKIVNYLHDHHHFPKDRFFVRKVSWHRSGVWNRWVVIRKEGTALPEKPPEWELPTAQHSLASRPKPGTSSRAPVFEQEPQSMFAKVFKPSFHLQWFSVDTDPRASDRKRANWLGFRAEGEGRITEREDLAVGLRGHYFSTFTAMSDDAKGISISDMTFGPFLYYRPEPTEIGQLVFRLHTGIYSAWRNVNSSAFLPTVLRGPFFDLEASTTLDGALRFSVYGGYTFVEDGITHLGGRISHQVFTVGDYDWAAQATFRLSLADASASTARENHTVFQIGLSSSI